MEGELILQSMRINISPGFLTLLDKTRASESIERGLRNEFSGNVDLFFLAQPDFDGGLIQLTSKVPRNPTFVLNSKFPGLLRHPLTKQPGFFHSLPLDAADLFDQITGGSRMIVQMRVNVSAGKPMARFN